MLKIRQFALLEKNRSRRDAVKNGMGEQIGA